MGTGKDANEQSKTVDVGVFLSYILPANLDLLILQVMPFVALRIYGSIDGEREVSNETIRNFLLFSLGAWLVTNMAFFCSIDLSYARTFFGMKTASQYTCERFLTSEEDSGKFDAVFLNRASYSQAIFDEVKKWLAENIDRWIAEKPDWFKIDEIPDEMLP